MKRNCVRKYEILIMIECNKIFTFIGKNNLFGRRSITDAHTQTYKYGYKIKNSGFRMKIKRIFFLLGGGGKNNRTARAMIVVQTFSARDVLSNS